MEVFILGLLQGYALVASLFEFKNVPSRIVAFLLIVLIVPINLDQIIYYFISSAAGMIASVYIYRDENHEFCEKIEKFFK